MSKHVGAADNQEPKMTITEAFDLFIYEQRFRNNSPATIEYYNIALAQFMKYVGADEQVSELDITTYKDYVVYLSTQRLKSTSINTYIRAVKAFYNFLIEDEHIADCSRKLKLIRAKKEEINPLSDEEIEQLLSCFDISDVLQLRNKCLVLLMLDSGLRRSETTRLKVCDVDIINKCLLVNGKGNKQRFVPMGASTYEHLMKYAEMKSIYRKKKTDSFFLDVHNKPLEPNAIDLIFQKLKTQSGIERLHAHLLRHTFATLYLVDGGNLEMLRLILGHSSFAVTQLYLHLASNYKLIRESHRSHVDNMNKLTNGTP